MLNLLLLLARADSGGGGGTGSGIPLGGIDWASSGCVTSNGVAQLTCIPIIFNNIVNGALALAGIVGLFIVIWSGLKYINSRGDQKKIDDAKKTLTYSFLGLLVIFLSFAIVNLIAAATGVECIRSFGFGNCK